MDLKGLASILWLFYCLEVVLSASRQFTGEGFVEYRTTSGNIINSDKDELRVEFSTVQPSGLLFYARNSGGQFADYVALELVGGRLSDNNLSANGTVTKKPTEQDDLAVKAFYTSKYMDMHSPIIPCDGETTDGKTETSNNNGTKKESNKGGEAVSLNCQNEVAGRPNNASSRSGGGGDDDDNRKPHMVLSNCKRDDQAAEDDKKDEVEDEEIVAHAGESEDDGGSNDDADVEYECEVESAEERKDTEQIINNNQVSRGQIPILTCTASEWSGPPSSCARETITVSLESVKKLKRAVLKVDVAQAKAMQAVTCPPYSSYKDPEGNSEALVHVEKAFTCRHNMRAWEECNDEHCQALQQFLRHTQNCHMRVLGGCEQCIRFKDALQSHASTCKELPGKCVVNKCDDIREYLKNNALPGNRNWKYNHDKLFFEPSPPRTPAVTLPGNLCSLPFEAAPHESNMQLSRSCPTYDSDYESNLCNAFDLELSNADDDDEFSENETRRSDTSSADADHDYEDDADDDVDDYGDDVIGVGDGASGSANAGALVVSRTEGEWQGPRSAALSTEQHLHSLQSDLFFSLPAEELSKLVVTAICEDSYMTDNDVNEVISSEEDFDYQNIVDQISMNASQASRQDGSYSVSDLTKVNITDIDGNIMFSIRERPTTTYGTLGRDLHGNITNVFGIEAFVLVQNDGVTPLDVHAEIGEHEQALRVFRAHDTDDWQPFRWRVNLFGLVEQYKACLFEGDLSKVNS